MLPGQKYTPEEILKLLWRRKWLLIAPLFIAVLCTLFVSLRLPKKYLSETLILVIPQRVPESYVRSTVTTRIEDRLSSLREQILSRSRLERVVTDFNLYPVLRQTAPMEDVIDAMRHNIDVSVARGDAFRISFTSGDPRIAQRVTERLASMFIEENLRDREVQAEGTNQFLDSQLEDARRRLIEHEKKLEEYKRRYSGQLPTQVQSNLQAIQNAQIQLQALNESINRDRDRRLVVERQLADLRSAPPPAQLSPQPPNATDVAPTLSSAQLLDLARAKLRTLELHYTSEHPDVVAARRQVKELEAKVVAENSAPRKSDEVSPVAPSAAELQRQHRIAELDAELQNIDAQVSRKQGQQRQLEEAVAAYQAKVDSAPTRESELTELTRDYATLQNTYTSLLTKREDSKVAANLERRQVGEQFKVLDQASVPERPFSPNLRMINAMGAAAGLALGLGLIGLLEYWDRTLRTEEEVLRVIQLPVLALVPMMASERERQTRRRRQVFAAVAILLVVAGSGAALVLWKLQLL